MTLVLYPYDFKQVTLAERDTYLVNTNAILAASDTLVEGEFTLGLSAEM
jgi:uncharacterized protein (AIM24 family)